MLENLSQGEHCMFGCRQRWWAVCNRIPSIAPRLEPSSQRPDLFKSSSPQCQGNVGTRGIPGTCAVEDHFSVDLQVNTSVLLDVPLKLARVHSNGTGNSNGLTQPSHITLQIQEEEWLTRLQLFS